MNPQDPRDQHTARYEAGYQPGNYREAAHDRDHGYPSGPGYGQDPGYGQEAYGAYEQPGYPDRQPRPQQGPDVNIGMFTGGVFAAAVVTALAAWLCAWIIEIIATRASESGKFGVWNPMAQDAYWFAVVAFICTLLAGVLWYLLRLGTPSPELFFNWIIGILTAAAVIIPLALSSDLWVGISTGIEHLVIGLPILSMVRMVGAKSIVYP
ncbi:hypothetical protein [Nocardia brevicatena]|uniref:hypothetical protein n=1 Tax=Nocardia brevicatena TaxID=37327 RepID=UPI0002E15738|nr:hypothetical protein [Nocardia brevicatena]